MAASEIPSVATVSLRRLNGLGMLVPLGAFDTLFPLDIEYIGSIERATHACRVVSRAVKAEACLAPQNKSPLFASTDVARPQTACSMHVHAILIAMTRKQVAVRLGKSLATVRRIEGVLLHPTRDARGVHRFDETEVETLARQVKDGRTQLVREFGPSNANTSDFDLHMACEECAGLGQRVTTLLEELDNQRRRHEREVREFMLERAAHEAEAKELVEQLAEFIELVER